MSNICVEVRGVKVGGNNPIVIQSMTNTDTEDVDATVKQVLELYKAGSELVRVTVNTRKAAQAIPELRSQIGSIPLIGDFHYNGHKLLKEFPLCAQSLDKIRINPGTVGSEQTDENFLAMLDVAKEYDLPIRIGGNWGSLPKTLLTEMMERNAKLSMPLSSERVELATLVESVLRSAELAIDYGVKENKIILSTKTSKVKQLIEAYELLAADPRCVFPLHLGLTEAGTGPEAIVRTTAGLTPLLTKKIGDTIRVSYTPGVGEPRTLEVQIAQSILQELGIRTYFPTTTSCPGCGRTTSDEFIKLTQETQRYVERKLPDWIEKYGEQARSLSFAVMGCVVNGPGESRRANLGISLPGNNEHPSCPVYKDGEHIATVKGTFEEIKNQWFKQIDNYISNLK